MGPCQKSSKASKYFRHFSTFFAQGKKRQKSSKFKCQNYFSIVFDNVRAAPVFWPPFWGALTLFEKCHDIATFCHPAEKGLRQKESGKKVAKKATEASEKVTKKQPNMRKSIKLLLPTSFSGTLILRKK